MRIVDDYKFSTEENRRLLLEDDKCDKYDYLAAVACGALGGVIDVFLVGTPGNTTLGKWTDSQVNQAVMAFSKKMGWKPTAANANNVNSAIGHLERTFRVNYDQRKPGDVGNLFNISPNSHHMMSLAHSPDIVGLFFSILNQFTSTSSFVANGQLITIRADTHELQGGNLITNVICGIANWFGHLMSDIAGSSGSHGRGTGIVMPFYEFFGFCKFGSFSTQSGTKDVSEIAMQAFTQGYDFRYGLAMAMPVVITDVLIKLIWGLRRHFQYRYPIRDCIPSSRHATLRMMLLTGHGTLCAIDAIDAGVRSGGEPINFFLRLNLVAWFRFVTLVLKEVLIRVGLSDALYDQVEAFRRVNAAMREYLAELERIDLQQYRRETEKYRGLQSIMSAQVSEKEFNRMLVDYCEANGIAKPWTGDFDSFMGNRQNHLVFR
ncbi:MAG: hypothetical protein LUE29_12500 [Lachnospiraceae bacterium]|nr:hypothetical protein [Lachnospiraceae bacterium]